MARFNESEDKMECYVAGAKFISKFIELTKNWDHIDKVKYMIFTLDKARSIENLDQFGLRERNPVEITVSAEEFMNFLD